MSYAWDVNRSTPGILQDSQGNKYVYGLGLISRTDNTGAQEYYLYDALGSTTGLANGTGTVTGSYAYDVFGAIRQQTGTSPNEFTYTGEQVDSSGPQYLRARYYDSATGRLLSRDSIPYLQRYPYAANNPVLLTDPSGMCFAGLPCPGGDCIGHPIRCGQHIVRCVKDPIECAIDATYAQRAPVTTGLENFFRGHSDGDVHNKEGGIRLITNCRGLCDLVQAPAFTIGHTIFTTAPFISEVTLRHESAHVRQYEILGDLFWLVYGGNSAVSALGCLDHLGGGFTECVRSSNILEILAGPSN